MKCVVKHHLFCQPKEILMVGFQITGGITNEFKRTKILGNLLEDY